MNRILLALVCVTSLSVSALAAAPHDKNQRPSNWNKHSAAESHSSNSGHKASLKPGWFKRSGNGGLGKIKR